MLIGIHFFGACFKVYLQFTLLKNVLYGCEAKFRCGNMNIWKKKKKVEGSETKRSHYEPKCRRCVTFGRCPRYISRCDPAVCRWRAATPVLANGTPKQDVWNSPGLGLPLPERRGPEFSQLSARRNALQIWHVKQSAAHNWTSPPYFLWPNPLFNNLKLQKYSPWCFSRGKSSFSTCLVLRQQGHWECTLCTVGVTGPRQPTCQIKSNVPFQNSKSKVRRDLDTNDKRL